MGSLAKDLTPPLWNPDRKKMANCHLEVFRRKINTKYGLNLENYHDLHQWSVKNRSKFWEEIWDYTGVIFSQSFIEVVDEKKQIHEIPKWFKGAKLNYAENLLERGNNDDIAIYFKGEGHPKLVKYTYSQLRNEVASWALALKSSGIEKGDVIAGILPNCPETLFAVLACASLGATWTCTSAELGATGVIERFKQTEPKILISANGVYYNGKIHPLLNKLEEISNEIPTIKKVVIVPFVDDPANMHKKWPKDWVNSNDFLQDFRSNKNSNVYEQLSFDHPLFIMYSSGTTGKPKCMVHSAGGTLIKHLEEHILQSDLRPKDIMFYYTTVGWMMYNWLISGLASGCAIVLYDGAPSPSLWDMIDDLDITIFGTSAKWIAVQEDLYKNHPERFITKHPLNKEHTPLRMILSTGSPLKPQSFDFIHTHVKKDALLGSISGGTDIIGCFMGQNTSLPVFRGEIQSYHLGCDLDCFNDDGISVRGERGELVVRSSFPSMPTKFHNDVNNILYKKAYFTKYTGIWAHGDFLMINPFTRGLVMLGRSDATLNPNGVRFGSAEIYQVVEQFIEVNDSVCIAQRNSQGTEERVLLFVKPTQGFQLSEDLILRIKKAIRDQLSPRHVPALILQVQDIPYTISGKKVEIAVRNIIEGEEVKNISALANPQCLQLFKNIPQLLENWS